MDYFLFNVQFTKYITYRSAPKPPNVMLKIKAVDQRYPTVQLHNKFFINLRLPKHSISPFTVQFVL